MWLAQGQKAGGGRGSQEPWEGRPRAGRHQEAWEGHRAVQEKGRGSLGAAATGKEPFLPLRPGHKAKERGTNGQTED